MAKVLSLGPDGSYLDYDYGTKRLSIIVNDTVIFLASTASRAGFQNLGAPSSYNTAGNVTYTAADLMSGIIIRDPNGASRSDVLPTAALLVAALPGAAIGDTLRCLIVNGADAAETITLTAGSGGGFDANQTATSRIIDQNRSKFIFIRLTNVTPGAEAYVVYA